MHSNCVLAFDVEKSRAIVEKYYGAAAQTPQPGLCCPIQYDAGAVRHIPQEVMDRFYGCGSPITQANPRAGETVVDLGSGGGIDIFIAAKYVGAEGRAIGIDMTDPMLEIANRNKPKVAANLGYDVAEFRKGFLEKVPVDSRSVNLITSNCVINLSPDKNAVFAEMWRMLKDHGRIVISDIVSEVEVPPWLRVNHELWGECISGALTERQLLADLEKAGFYGLAVLGKTFWKTVEGFQFFSLTVRGYKFEKRAGCAFIGQSAMYNGPFKFTVDEEGHLFPRHEPVAVCTDTFAKLSHLPYSGQFTLINAAGVPAVGAEPQAVATCCAPEDPCCAAGDNAMPEQAVGGCDPSTGCC
jgi:SAM-dependent methyltransferase